MSDFDALLAFLALLAAVAVVLVLRGQMTLSISRAPGPPQPRKPRPGRLDAARKLLEEHGCVVVPPERGDGAP